MKYLVLECDIGGGQPLREENELLAAGMPVDLPADLVAEMLAWNDQMADAIVAKTEADHALARLNSDGESLATRIAVAVSDGAKVRYLSE